jgi:hypothetical protein
MKQFGVDVQVTLPWKERPLDSDPWEVTATNVANALAELFPGAEMLITVGKLAKQPKS